jgi:hypothetical protein
MTRTAAADAAEAQASETTTTARTALLQRTADIRFPSCGGTPIIVAIEQLSCIL